MTKKQQREMSPEEFANKAVQESLTSYEKQIKRINGTISNFTKSQKKYSDVEGQVFSQINKSVSAQNKSINAQLKAQRVVEGTVKLNAKLTAQQQKQFKSQDQLMRQYAKIATLQERLTRKGSSGAGAGGGFGFNLPSIISIVAIERAISGLVSYQLGLGHGNQKAQALAMGRDIQGYGRDQSLFGSFAGQRFSNRFASKQEISGLRNLSAELRKALGTEAGSELTLKLTDSLKGSQEQLTKFLVLAKSNLPQALRMFESANVQDFALALSAVTMRQNELGQATSALDSLFRNLEDVWEDVAKIAAPVVADIAKSLKMATDQGSAFRSTVIDMAEGGVSGIAQLIDYVGGLNLAVKQAQFSWMALFGGDDYDKLQLTAEIQALEKLGSHRANDVSAYFAKLREKVDAASLSFNVNLTAANAERNSLEAMSTSAERAALSMARLDESIEMQNLSLALHRSRIARFENDPLGFSASFTETYATVQALNDEIATMTDKLTQIQSIEHQTREDRKQALQVETSINELMAERNRLLAGQRRGYLDAVQAQSLVAGRFQKLIFSQDHAIALALDAGIAKANKLLGATGTVSGIGPFRFSMDQAANVVQAAKHSAELAKYMGVPTGGMSVPSMPAQAIATAVQSTMTEHRIESGGSVGLTRSGKTGVLLVDVANALQDASVGLKKLEADLDNRYGLETDKGSRTPGFKIQR